MNNFRRFKEKLGEGTFGKVFKGSDRRTGELVAMKFLRAGNDREGIPTSTIREIKILQEITHPNIVKIRTVFAAENGICIVYEYVEVSLLQIIQRPKPLAPSDIKSVMQMSLAGLQYCHQNMIVHRDIKPGNIMVNSQGVIKLIDFGLARTLGSPFQKLSPRAATAAYRSPEMLFGSNDYTFAVDIWALGCVMAEMYTTRCVFQSTSDLAQLDLIFEVCGCPPHEILSKLGPNAERSQYEPRAGINLGDYLRISSKEATKFLSGLLLVDPMQRLTAKSALEHTYFTTPPAPTSLKQDVINLLSEMAAASGKAGPATRQVPARHENRPTSSRALDLGD
eukprot:TRINITY_DN1534_c0_g1_i1.p1 TRINITY_DN1534_c0_g1~~TRINITY_DN1534_c0_g1_i1.p1  ORF type:complete len:337 (-),score=68.44 TRINITY_DN1534_c0_g1_i1:1501-2511(-)